MRGARVAASWLYASQPCKHFSSLSCGFSGAPEPLPTRRVVVTGLGLVTPLAVGLWPTWDALVSGATGVRALVAADLPEEQQPLLHQLPCRVAALLPQPALAHALQQLQEEQRRYSPFILYAMLAAEEALTAARWGAGPGAKALSQEQKAATGVAMGCGMSASTEVAQAWSLLSEGKLRRLSPYFVPRILANMGAGAVAIRWGFQGPNHAASTACATGAHAIGDAFRMVQRGDADVMVAGASEACVDAISIAGFSRLRALSTGFNSDPTAASRPFDEARDGFVMGEGAGALVLEERGHALRRGVQVHAEVRGYGLAADAHHITQPHPEGVGAQLSMRRAMRLSGVAPHQVAYVNAHATSTPLGDEVEAQAIHAVFGPAPQLAVSSTKGATGHLLGAAGAVEAVFSIMALYTGIAPPTLNLNNPSPAVAAALPGLVSNTAAVLRSGPKAALCNSFGFGGTLASLLFTTC